MSYPKVTKIEYIKTIIPKCSSGTGYSEPNIFKFWLDNGDYFIDYVDTWYRSDEQVVEECRRTCSKMPIMNQDETVEMLLEYYHDR